MSQKEDLLNRIKSKPKDFTVPEMDSLMAKCGCEKKNRGKTSGSAVAYKHLATGSIFKCHLPHPQKEFPAYVIEQAIAFLTGVGEM